MEMVDYVAVQLGPHQLPHELYITAQPGSNKAQYPDKKMAKQARFLLYV